MDFLESLDGLGEEELVEYADQITAEMEKLQEEAHRVGAARQEIFKQQQEELRNRPKTEEEKALDQVAGAVEE